MSRFNDDDDPLIELQTDYNDIRQTGSTRLPVEIVRHPDRFLNMCLLRDSVEYTIVKN